MLAGVARGIAKATVFGLANPEAAVRIHWKLYPASKPQSGDDANMGARPLRRAIQKYVEDPVSELLIQSRDERVEAIEIRVGPDGLTVVARETEPIGLES